MLDKAERDGFILFSIGFWLFAFAFLYFTMAADPTSRGQLGLWVGVLAVSYGVVGLLTIPRIYRLRPRAEPTTPPAPAVAAEPTPAERLAKKILFGLLLSGFWAISAIGIVALARALSGAAPAPDKGLGFFILDVILWLGMSILLTLMIQLEWPRRPAAPPNG